MDEAKQAKKIRGWGWGFLVASIVTILTSTGMGTQYHTLPRLAGIVLALLWVAWGIFGIIVSVNCLKRRQGYLKKMYVLVCATILMLLLMAVLNFIELRRPENNPSFIAHLEAKYDSLGADYRQNVTKQEYVQLTGNRMLGATRKTLFAVEAGVIAYLIYILFVLKKVQKGGLDGAGK
jgi:hypothetical protein